MKEKYLVYKSPKAHFFVRERGSFETNEVAFQRELLHQIRL